MLRLLRSRWVWTGRSSIPRTRSHKTRPQLSESGYQPVDRELSHLLHGRDAHLVQRSLGGRADSVDPPNRQWREECLDLTWAHDRQAVGLAEIGCDLGYQLVGRDTDADRESSLLTNPSADVLGDLGCTVEFAEMLADIEKGLIQRQGLDDGV